MEEIRTQSQFDSLISNQYIQGLIKIYPIEDIGLSYYTLTSPWLIRKDNVMIEGIDSPVIKNNIIGSDFNTSSMFVFSGWSGNARTIPQPDPSTPFPTNLIWLDRSEDIADSEHIDRIIYIESGNGLKEVKKIINFSRDVSSCFWVTESDVREATIDGSWNTVPDITSQYRFVLNNVVVKGIHFIGNASDGNTCGAIYSNFSGYSPNSYGIIAHNPDIIGNAFCVDGLKVLNCKFENFQDVSIYLHESYNTIIKGCDFFDRGFRNSFSRDTTDKNIININKSIANKGWGYITVIDGLGNEIVKSI